MCQRYYPIPFDILKPAPMQNILTVLDELGVTNISAVGLAVSTDGLPAPTVAPTPTPCQKPAEVREPLIVVLFWPGSKIVGEDGGGGPNSAALRW